MSGDESETKLDKKIELIVKRAMEKHMMKLREPPPRDPKGRELSTCSSRNSGALRHGTCIFLTTCYKIA